MLWQFIPHNTSHTPSPRTPVTLVCTQHDKWNQCSPELALENGKISMICYLNNSINENLPCIISIFRSEGEAFTMSDESVDASDVMEAARTIGWDIEIRTVRNMNVWNILWGIRDYFSLYIHWIFTSFLWEIIYRYIVKGFNKVQRDTGSQCKYMFWYKPRQTMQWPVLSQTVMVGDSWI